MFEKFKQKKEENKKVLIGAGVVGGVVLLGLTYRQGMIKGMTKGAYFGGFYIGRTIGLAYKNGTINQETFEAIKKIISEAK